MDYAIKSLKMRADSGDVNAMIELGKKFLSGDGVRQSSNKAEKYFKKAAEGGSAEGYVELGKLYNKINPYGNLQLCESVWEKAVSLGSDEAASLIASLYYEQGLAPRSLEKAIWWLEKPANSGYVPAQVKLGYLYYNYYEQLGEESIRKSLSWFKKAAEQNDAKAQYNYGVIIANFDTGTDPKTAFKEGINWLTKAAQNGYAEAYYELGNIYAYAYDEKFIDIKKAEESFIAAINAGVYEATTALGSFYCDNGDIEKGIAVYTEAAEDGNKIAMELLGDIYFEGELTERDFDKAFYWYNRAFDKYSDPSYFGLGRCYLYGAGVERDEKKAFKYLKKAAKYDRDAKFELGNCYYNGWGVNQDKREAKRIWENLDDHEKATKALEKYFGITN